MALKALLDSLDGLPADVAKEYKKIEATGKYVLDVETVNGISLDDTAGLKSALSKERQEKAKALADLKKFEGIDDPEAARDALSKAAEFANFNPEQKIAEGIKQRELALTKAHQKTADELKAKLDTAVKQLEKTLITNVATKAIADNKGAVELLLPHVAKHVKMRALENGEYVAEVVDDNGTPVLLDANTPMSIGAYVETLKKDATYARAFDGTPSSGSGAKGGGTPPKTPSGNGAKGKIPVGDMRGLGANLEALAKGEVGVDFGR